MIEATMTIDLLAEVGFMMEGNCAVAVETSARRIKNSAQSKIEHPPKTGHIYHAKDKPSPHQASKAGEAPANWTGALVSSIHAEEVTPLEWIVRGGGEEAPYGTEFLEFGSPGGQVKPRPFFTPASEEERPLFNQSVKEAVIAAGELKGI